MCVWIKGFGAEENKIGMLENGIKLSRIAHAGGVKHGSKSKSLDTAEEVGDKLRLEQGFTTRTGDTAPVSAQIGHVVRNLMFEVSGIHDTSNMGEGAVAVYFMMQVIIVRGHDFPGVWIGTEDTSSHTALKEDEVSKPRAINGGHGFNGMDDARHAPGSGSSVMMVVDESGRRMGLSDIIGGCTEMYEPARDGAADGGEQHMDAPERRELRWQIASWAARDGAKGHSACFGENFCVNRILNPLHI